MKETFIRLLAAQPTTDPTLGLTKMNIHIPVRGAAQNYCINLNRMIRENTETEIDLGPTSFQIPHLSLYIGFADSEGNFNKILETLADLSESIEPFYISLTQAYLKEPDRHYVFVGVDQITQIRSLKSRIRDAINEYIIPLDWDVVAEVAHITIGYINHDFDMVSEVLHSQSREVGWMADALAVSFSGKKGSCIGTIKTFEFVRANEQA